MEINIPIMLKFKLSNKRNKNDSPSISLTTDQTVRSIKIKIPIHTDTTKPTKVSKKRGRKNGNFPKNVVDKLSGWLDKHRAKPYPTEGEKADLASQTGLTLVQVNNWFINARRRIINSSNVDTEKTKQTQTLTLTDTNTAGTAVTDIYTNTDTDIDTDRDSYTNTNIYKTVTDTNTNKYLESTDEEINDDDDDVFIYYKLR